MKRYAILLFMLVMFLLGCGNTEENKPISVALVAGVHSNACELPLDSSTVYDALYRVSRSYGQITFVNCDGDPQVFYQANIPVPTVDGLSEEKEATIATKYADTLQIILRQDAVAVEPEVDTLKAISKAAQALRNSETEGNKELLILDSGLSTTGYINFCEGYLDADKEEIVTALKKAEAIPDLEGVTVYWSFCAETTYPQEELSEKQKMHLKSIWEAILMSGGAKDVIFKDDFTSTTPYQGLPTVSTVDVEERTIEHDVEVTEVLKYSLDANAVNFIGDTAEFLDPKAAEEEIISVATQLLKNTENKVYIVGTTASGETEYCNRLSKERAEAVKEVLLKYGVPEEQIQETIGLGCRDYWHITDIDENGKMIEEYAWKNRKVMIIPVSSPDAIHVHTQ